MNIITAEALTYTSFVEQRNPVSKSDAENKLLSIVNVLKRNTPSSKGVEPEAVFIALKIENSEYRNLTNEQIIARLENGIISAISWKAGEIYPYAFHKSNPDNAVLLKRASHGLEYVIIDRYSKRAIMSLYCGNPLQGNRIVKKAVEPKKIERPRISPPKPSYRAPKRERWVAQKEEVWTATRTSVPEPVRRQPVVYQQPSSGINLLSLFGGLMGAGSSGFFNGSSGNNYYGLPAYSGCNPAVTPGCGGSYIPQANGGLP